MPRLRLRPKILLYTSALVIALIGAMLLYVNYEAERFVSANVASRLQQGRQRIELIASERVTGLRLTAQLVASFPGLKALLSTTDLATVSDFLGSYQRENQRADLLLVLDPSGRVLGRTDRADEAPIPDATENWIRPALTNGAAIGLLATDGAAYDSVAVPSAAAGAVFGFVLAGARIDAAFAQRLSAASEEQVVVAGPSGVLGSTIPEPQLPWRTADAWEVMRHAAGEVQSTDVAGESYAALPFGLGAKENRVLAVILQSRDVALAPYRRIQLGLALVGLAAVAVGVSASFVLARSVTAPVGKLVEGTRRVAAGNFGQPIDVRTGDEIGDLAQSFNAMMRGLRERADMQKFISQSTVEMIRSDAKEDMNLGRRVELTVFFSDIRSFTELSEKRSPESVVTLLNSSLSLQAGIVHKYGGDIDKYVGDCVVALFFGETSAMDAIQCAIEIEKSLVQFNAQLPSSDRLQVGIGVVTGDALLGSIGSEDRRDFTAIGSNVNLCARLCSMAGPGEILVAESSYERVRDQVPAERLEPLSVKGFSQPIPVYRISYRAGQVTAAS